MPQQLSQTLNLILKQTSRAFYLSLVVLPSRSRRPLSLAYLLARAADTVADSETGLEVDRSETLRQLKHAIHSEPGERIPIDLARFVPEHSGERQLLCHVPELLAELDGTPEDQKRAIKGVVSTLIDGMLWDQELFARPSSDGLSDSDLDRYTYFVAGCVGPFWSEICAGDDQRLESLKSAPNLEMAIEFGKALQWVNILRDIPKDQENGRCYLPHLSASNFGQRFVSSGQRALRAFSQAVQYPLLFPPSYTRDLFAVFLPLVLGLRTLACLFSDGGPRRNVRVKVKRAEVFFWLAVGSLVIHHNGLLKFVLSRLQKRAHEALHALELSGV